ncbi:transcription antitermination factor NusB [Candidatus Parcubacteria bacterium]|nr:transcription antitermination factor NusB [Candidatus Parcubacteria bacterium]
MANRHLSRSIVLQTLFEWDFNNGELNTEEAIKRNVTEFAPGLSDDAFINELLDQVLKKQKVLDDIIAKAAPDWPIDKINPVDRNVLRIGLVELLFSDRKQVPPKVAINEAIELAKTFSGENSGKFVNGVLGAVYKELGEPGKDDIGKKKEGVDITKLPIEKKAGAVVYTWHQEALYFALVHDVFGYWTLSKGGVKSDETPEDAAIREIKDEIDLDITIDSLLGETEYIANHPEKGKIRKQVSYFLAQAEYKSVKLQNESGGLDNAKWFPASEIADLTIYESIVDLLTQAIEKITSK